MTSIDQLTKEIQAWFDTPRFNGITRLYTARQIAEQRGTIAQDFTVAREAATSTPSRYWSSVGPLYQGMAVDG